MIRRAWRWMVLLAVGPTWLHAAFPSAGGVWPDGAVQIFPEFANSPMNPTEAESATREAMTAWNTFLQRIQLSQAASTGQPWYDNGRNEIFFARKVYGEEFGRGVLAITLQSFDREQRVEADIVVNGLEAWAVYHGAAKNNPVDLRRVLVHELGHVLGLDHPDEVGQNVSSVMNAHIGDVETPTADDQSGVRSLYDRGSRAAPVIVGGPVVSASEVPAGGQVKFEVLAGGRGPYTYSWRRSGATVNGGTAAVLRIDPVTLQDSGNYSVTVGNGVSTVTSLTVSFKVTPVSPPRLIDVFANWDLAPAVGGDVTLSPPDIEAAGITTYEWKHNGVVIPRISTSPLLLRDIQFSDGGEYTVTATNAAGSLTGRAFHVTVLPAAPARFLRDPAPVAYAIGSSVSLLIEASAIRGPSTTYQWKKNGADIPGGNGRTLDISNFQAADAGAYTLSINDSFGVFTSAPLMVTVRGTAVAPLAVVHQPTPITAFAGTRTAFGASVVGTPFSYRWLKDGVPLTAPSEMFINEGTADLTHVIPSLLVAADAGVYSVEVFNAMGSTTSRGARLTVLPGLKPIVTTQPSAIIVALGAPAMLVCGARVSYKYDLQQQFPGWELKAQWFKDGVPLQPPAEDQFGYSFTATAASAGQYFARITSPAGVTTDTKTVTVTVTSGPLPLIPVQPRDLLYNMADSEELRFASLGQDRIRRDFAPGADSSSLQLVSATGPAFGGITPGTYTITASKGGVTETSQPFTIGFIPPIAPVIARHPVSQRPDFGQPVGLGVSVFSFSPVVTFQWSKDGIPVPGATNSIYSIASFAATNAGSYRVTVSGGLGPVISEAALLELADSSPAPVIIAQPLSETIAEGRRPSLSVSASGSSLSYQWFKDGQLIPDATGAALFLLGVPADSGTYFVKVSNRVASVTSRTATLRVLATERPPEILFPPQSQTAVLNGDVTLSVSADGGPLPDRYQWRKDGVDLPGANDARLRLTNVQPGDAGSYTVVAYNRLGSATSSPARLAVDPSGRLVNLATRAGVGTGADVLIAGFVISGVKPRSVLVRGVGDQLSEFGVKGVLRNPLLQLFDANKKLVARSDDWSAGAEFDGDRRMRMAGLRAAEIEAGAFPLREDTQDGAVVATLAPGSYTAQLSGVVETTGIGLIEVYELGKPSTDRLINLSCRSMVGTGSSILIPGLVIKGSAPRRLLIRAIGPGLAAFGVGGMLADPQLTIFRGDEQIAQNDNWSGASPAQAATAVGAFPLAVGSKDAALLIDLPPGGYTVQVSGVQDTTGIALVEVYEVAP